jgi:hypothetical protein
MEVLAIFLLVAIRNSFLDMLFVVEERVQSVSSLHQIGSPKTV